MNTAPMIYNTTSSSLINIHIIGVPKGKEKGSQKKKRVMNKSKNFPNVMK